MHESNGEKTNQTEIRNDETQTVNNLKPQALTEDTKHLLNGKESTEKVETENDIEKELEKLNENIKRVEINNSTGLYRSKRKALKKTKSLKLKQLQIDLKNEEAKLILLKRLYYSQRISNQPLTQQQQ